MEYKYNQLHLERYSKELANLLCDRHFATHDTINGPELISFTPVKQVNLFVIKELLLRWHHEMANLRSPYFDYENEEVKEALLNFMNVLSRKILMKQNAFEPLLQKAIYDTFLVVLNPVVTFEEKFLRILEEITLPKLHENLKYMEINKQLFAGFVDTLSPSNRDRDYILSRFRLYINANKETLAPVASLIEKFNPLLPISEEDLLPQADAPVQPAAASKPPVNDLSKYASYVPKEKKEVIAPVHNVQQPTPAPTPSPATARQPLVRAQDDSEEEEKQAIRPTLNDNFRKGTPTSLADAHSNRKIESLKNSISINQRFSFINELFNGNNMEYYQAIQTLDALPNVQQAQNYVTHDLANKYDWNKKQEHVSKLLRLIERKFA